MIKAVSTPGAPLMATNGLAKDPSGLLIDFGDNGMTIPTPILLLGLLIATVGCFWMDNYKYEVHERDALHK